MNLLDAIFTSVWVSMGIASEVNPLMAFLLGLGSSFFILAKISLVSLCVLLLWRLKRFKISKFFIFPVFIAYLCAMVIHTSIAVDVFRSDILIIKGE